MLPLVFRLIGACFPPHTTCPNALLTIFSLLLLLLSFLLPNLICLVQYPPLSAALYPSDCLAFFLQPAPPTLALVEGPLLLAAINPLLTGEHGGEMMYQGWRSEHRAGFGWSQEESSWARLTGNDNDLRNLLFAPQQ